MIYSQQLIEVSDVAAPAASASDFAVDLLKMMTDTTFADVAFRVEGAAEAIRVHKFVLRGRSKHFDNMFARYKEQTFANMLIY